MELIVFSSAGSWKAEAPGLEQKIVNELFEAGLQTFHLRKPMFSVKELRSWLDGIAPEHRGKISLHTFHDLVQDYGLGGVHLSERQRNHCRPSREQVEYLLEHNSGLRLTSSFHDLAELRFAPSRYEFAFISPVFDSISKPHFRAAFDKEELKETVEHARNNVAALGGVNRDRLAEVANLGFAGAALLGAVWSSPDPVKEFTELKDICQNASQMCSA